MATAIQRSDVRSKVVLDGLRMQFRKLVTDIKAARLRRARFSASYAELVSLSDRELADLGIPRSNIRRVAIEASYQEEINE